MRRKRLGPKPVLHCVGWSIPCPVLEKPFLSKQARRGGSRRSRVSPTRGQSRIGEARAEGSAIGSASAFRCAPPSGLPPAERLRGPLCTRNSAAEFSRDWRANHLALAPPRPLIAEGDDRHLRTLGARRAKASGSQDGRRVPGLTRGTQSVLAPRSGSLPRETYSLALQELRDGPGRSRTCDLGIKSPLLYQLSYRPVVGPV
jgi:hypothetical protein